MKHLLLLLFTTACIAQNATTNDNIELDSVQKDKILYNGKSVFITQTIMPGDTIETASDASITFTCTNPRGLSVDGIKVGDPGENLKSKFPKSCQFKSIWSSNYSNLIDEYKYYYFVEISTEYTEYILFNIENKVIKKIEGNLKK